MSSFVDIEQENEKGYNVIMTNLLQVEWIILINAVEGYS